MASKQFYELTEITATADDDLLAVYDTSESIPEKVKKLTWANLISLIGSATATLTNKTIGASTLSGTMNASDQVIQRPKFLDSAETVQALGSKSSTFAIDLTAGNVATATLTGTGAMTISFSNPPASGAMGICLLHLTNGGLRTLTWTGVTWSGNVAPALSSSGVDVLLFMTTDGGTTWRGLRIWKTV